MAISESNEKLLSAQSVSELERGYRELCKMEKELDNKLAIIWEAKVHIMLAIELKQQNNGK